MKAIKLSAVRPNDYIKRKEDSNTVYVKGPYDRASKSFALSDCEDMNRCIMLKASTIVYVGFTY